MKDKKIIFLGSSVTYGEFAGGVSFADHLCEKKGFTMYKEAVSGTTLVDDQADSYVSRMKTIKFDNADLFVCQLSTNDAGQEKPLGKISDSKEISDFDTKTIAGAIEYIVAYAAEKWNCQIAFYTNPKYDCPLYEKMVRLLESLSRKWGFKIINLWDDADFNNISVEERELFMADPIHPTNDGYLKWWTPYFEASGLF